MKLSGNLQSSQTIDEKMKHHFLTLGIIEEAIASSQIEGASTIRRVAKKMILEKRTPNDKNEQMILNNYETMKFVEEIKGIELTENTLFHLHNLLTQKTTFTHKDIGLYRKDSDQIVISDDGTKGEIYHIPPKNKFLLKKMKRLIQYANDQLMDETFTHPIIKAILIHFWVGYLHPFVDGNGRLTRTLFYWYLQKHHYWRVSYLSLSKIIKNSKSHYRNAFIYSEQNTLDLSYFIDYNIKKIKLALTEFEKNVTETRNENKIWT